MQAGFKDKHMIYLTKSSVRGSSWFLQGMLTSTKQAADAAHAQNIVVLDCLACSSVSSMLVICKRANECWLAHLSTCLYGPAGTVLATKC